MATGFDEGEDGGAEVLGDVGADLIDRAIAMARAVFKGIVEEGGDRFGFTALVL